MAGGAKAYRQTAVTIPEHAIDRDAPTLRPAAPEFGHAEHGEWLELLRVFRDLTARDRARVLAFAEGLKATEGVA